MPSKMFLVLIIKKIMGFFVGNRNKRFQFHRKFPWQKLTFNKIRHFFRAIVYSLI